MIKATRREREVYELTETIENPKPDKRMVRNLSAATEFPSGLYLVIKTYHEFEGEELPKPSIRIEKRGWSGSVSSGMEADKAELLMSKLKPADESFETLAIELGDFRDLAEPVMGKLVEMGRLSLDDIREAYEIWLEEAE